MEIEWGDLKNKSAAELKEILAEKKKELHGLYFQAHNRQLKQVHKVSLAKKTIARILTLLRNKEQAKKQ